MPACWAVVGDVVGSRSHRDRDELTRVLMEAWDDVARRVPTGLGPATTVGDEFQALYFDRDAVLAATLWIRVALAGQAEVRMGIGVGDATVDEDAFPLGQDGPAWWSARAALEIVGDSERARGRLRRRIAVAGADDPLVDAYLVVRDEVLADLDRVDAEILTGLADGRPQEAIAAGVGIHESSVSRRITERGLRALLVAEGIGA